MGLFKKIFDDNSTVVGLCDLTQKTTKETYEITSKPKVLPKQKTKSSPQMQTIRTQQVQAQPQRVYSSNPYAPNNNFMSQNIQSQPQKVTINTYMNSQATPNKKIVNAFTQKQQLSQQNFFSMK